MRSPGAAVGLVLALGACARPGEVEFHVLDGGAGELVALDRRGLVRAREVVPGARLLAHDGEALWVAGAGETGGWLERRALDGAPQRLLLRAPQALAPGTDGDVYVLDGEADERVRLWQIEPWLTTRFLGEFPGASVLARDGGALLLGTRAGTLLRLRRDGAVLASLELGAPLVALESESGALFALLGGEAPRLVRLDRALEPRWSAALLVASAAVASAGERAWLVEGERLVRFGTGGARELEHELPLRGGPWRASAAQGSRVWLRGRGAWLELDSAGTRAWVVRSQGGFEALSAGVRRRAGAVPRRAGSSRRATRRAPARASSSGPRGPRPDPGPGRRA